MLVATPGQTAAYHPTPLHNSGGSGAPKQICHASSSSALAQTSKVINKLPVESSSVSNNSLMKTLSVRLNRGTEFLKGTVQKALISTTSITTTAANTSGGIHSASTGYFAKQNSSNTTTATTTTTKSLNSTGAGTSRLAVATAPSSAQLKLYTVPPTVTHRYPEKRLQTCSVDSLHKEMCHFKPIRSAPTTPWKCGSKSRGASLKIPKANLASKVNLNVNCDESAIWLEDNDDDDGEERADEQEVQNKDRNRKKIMLDAANHFTPKPSNSTLSTTGISTPTHQSAFVCLVAKMKNIATVTKSTTSIKSVELQKAKSNRRRPKAAAGAMHSNKIIKTTVTKTTITTTSTPVANNVPRKQILLRQRRNPFVYVKKLHLPAELIVSKNFRNLRQMHSTKSMLQQTPTATKKGANNNNNNNNKNKNRSVIAKIKSKKVLKKSKSKAVNIVQLAQNHSNIVTAATAMTGGGVNRKVLGKAVIRTSALTKNATGEIQRKVRKRKFIYDLSGLKEVESAQARKSARISKDCSNATSRTATTTPTTTTGMAGNSSINVRKANCRADTSARFTPPLTRSRLKEMSQCKLLAALEYRRRII